MQAQHFERLQAQNRKQISPIPNRREENYENHAGSYYKNDNSGFGISGEPTRADEFSQDYHNEGTFRVSQEKFHSTPSQNRTPQNTGQNWSSPEGTNSFMKKNTQSFSSQKTTTKILSPGRVDRPDRPDRLDSATAAMLRQTYTKWSAQHGRPDPSILDVRSFIEFCVNLIIE